MATLIDVEYIDAELAGTYSQRWRVFVDEPVEEAAVHEKFLATTGVDPIRITRWNVADIDKALVNSTAKLLELDGSYFIPLAHYTGPGLDGRVSPFAFLTNRDLKHSTREQLHSLGLASRVLAKHALFYLP